ncbi:MAG: PAS domain-containing protein [Flavobacteriales bacterium]|nr:PAS domain-containing protein [Flavobacteriales bacterium]
MITRINDSVTRVLGFEPEQLLQKKAIPFFKDNIQNHGRLLSFVEDGEKLNQLEINILNKDQILVPVLVSGIKMINDQGVLQGYILKMVDLRESRLAKEIEHKKEQLIQSEKLASLGQMAGSIAHEINNPLAIISGRAEMLTLKLKKNKVDHAYLVEGLESITNTINRISNIISNLKSFSRDGENHEKEWHSLKEIIDNTLSFCDNKFRNNNISIDVQVPNEIEVFCQNILISQVLMNLLNNSYDAIHSRKEKWVRFETSVTKKTVQLIITDSGNGISRKVSQHIFMPFFTTKETGNGTGLGLSLIDTTMKLHNGRIFVNHEVKNTQFILEFPIVQKQLKIKYDKKIGTGS